MLWFWHGPIQANRPKWLGEGAKGVQKVFWDEGAKVSKRALAPPKPCFAPVQPSISQVQKGFRPILVALNRQF